MSSNNGGQRTLGLFFDWNNTAGFGAITDGIIAHHGGDPRKFKDEFKRRWDLLSPDLRAERGRVKREFRARTLFDMQLRGEMPAISPLQQYEYGRDHVQAYPGFLEKIQEMKLATLEQSKGETRLHTATVTNTWGPVIYGVVARYAADHGGFKVLDDVMASGFRPFVQNKKLHSEPLRFVGEETKPLDIEFVMRAERIAPEDVLYWGNGFSDLLAFARVTRLGGVNFGVVNSDLIHKNPLHTAAKAQQAAEYMVEDRNLLTDPDRVARKKDGSPILLDGTPAAYRIADIIDAEFRRGVRHVIPDMIFRGQFILGGIADGDRTNEVIDTQLHQLWLPVRERVELGLAREERSVSCDDSLSDHSFG